MCYYSFYLKAWNMEIDKMLLIITKIENINYFRKLMIIIN